MTDDATWEDILPSVTKPARYTDHEWNVISKPLQEATLKFALVYPDVYEVGMSHLGLRILYHILNDSPGWLAERAYAPWVDLEQEMRARKLPLVSLESGLPLHQFDVIGITLPYEMNYSNVLNVIDLAGLPLRSRDRSEEHPLVIAGGAAVVNPEPLADFIDAFVLGEGEQVIVEIAQALEEYQGKPRPQVLRRLAQMEGVYVPSFYQVTYRDDGTVEAVNPTNGDAPEKVGRRVIWDFENCPYPTHQIVPFLECIHDRITLEIMRGCTRGCRFCQAGMVCRPVRRRSAATLLKLADRAVRSTGHDEISLLAFNAPDHPEIEELVSRLIEAHGPTGVGVSLPSLRVDSFSVNLAEKIQKVRKTGLTFAPEAGTARLRKVINKQVGEDDLFQVAEAAFAAGWTHLKLYFMIGLPTETDEDVQAIIDLVEELIGRGRKALGERKGRLRLALSIGAFVPKPVTPFQWVPQASIQEINRKHQLLQSGLRSKHLRLSWQQPELSWLEAVFARGDRRLGTVLERAWQLGCKFDAWSEQFSFEGWSQAFRDCGISPAFYANRERDHEEVFPWDHLDFGVTKEFLWQEAERAFAGQVTPDCRLEKCVECGACPEGTGYRV